jgi:serine/threonine protein kinase
MSGNLIIWLVDWFYKWTGTSPFPRSHPWRLERGRYYCISARTLRSLIYSICSQTNLLINEHGEPCICDFGVSRIIDCRGFTTDFVGTAPFMAPELFPDSDEEDIDSDVENSNFRPMVTKETDIYAYGLVALQVRSSGRYFSP